MFKSPVSSDSRIILIGLKIIFVQTTVSTDSRIILIGLKIKKSGKVLSMCGS
jgi:hypothetical protein